MIDDLLRRWKVSRCLEDGSKFGKDSFNGGYRVR